MGSLFYYTFTQLDRRSHYKFIIIQDMSFSKTATSIEIIYRVKLEKLVIRSSNVRTLRALVIATAPTIYNLHEYSAGRASSR